MSDADGCDLLCLDLPHAERIRTSLPSPEALWASSTLGKALADPTRLAVAAALLAGDELCVCDMAWVVGHAQNLTSHHLRQLRTAGLVTSRRDGKLVMYRLTPAGRVLVAAVLDPQPRPFPGSGSGRGGASGDGTSLSSGRIAPRRPARRVLPAAAPTAVSDPRRGRAPRA